jgi:hypothetical protein
MLMVWALGAEAVCWKADGVQSKLSLSAYHVPMLGINGMST